jgi:hypothetical protein
MSAKKQKHFWIDDADIKAIGLVSSVSQNLSLIILFLIMANEVGDQGIFGFFGLPEWCGCLIILIFPLLIYNLIIILIMTKKQITYTPAFNSNLMKFGTFFIVHKV